MSVLYLCKDSNNDSKARITLLHWLIRKQKLQNYL